MPPLQAGSSLKLPTGQFLNGRPPSKGGETSHKQLHTRFKKSVTEILKKYIAIGMADY